MVTFQATGGELNRATMRTVRGNMIGSVPMRGATRLRRLLLCPLAAAALLGACGDGDGSGGDSDEFAREANSLCRTAEQRAVAIEAPGNPAQTATYAEGMHEVLVELRDGLGELEPPDGGRGSFELYLVLLDEDISTMEALGAAAESGDKAQIQAIFSNDLDERAGQLAVEQLGLPSCGAAANAIAKTP